MAKAIYFFIQNLMQPSKYVTCMAPPHKNDFLHDLTHLIKPGVFNSRSSK